jgi:hypothetical protein
MRSGRYASGFSSRRRPSWRPRNYIAPNGNNANPGTEAEPWQTITKANQTLAAGDPVYIKAGTYCVRGEGLRTIVLLTARRPQCFLSSL